MKHLPTGTITFLFTDIEGSTRLWEQHPETMRTALAQHDALLRTIIENHGGYVFKNLGDAFCAAFPTAPTALAAVVDAQLSLHRASWPEATPIRVRMALHTGAAQERDNDYFGPVLNRVARLLATGYGEQTLVSGATFELIRDHLPADVGLRDLGSHRLKDLERPEQVYQLTHPDLADTFPPLKSLDSIRNNLPQQFTSFIGREKEMQEVRTLLGRNRLLTLVGTGGTGKTRLLLQVAADLLDDYPDGVWLIELASLTDPTLVPQAVAQALSVKEQTGQNLQQTLTESLKSQKALLLLDNCEHLLAACAPFTAVLLRSCTHIQILATSREALGIAGEQVYRVPSLTLPDPKQVGASTPASLTQYESVRLFIERATLAQPAFTVTNQNAPALAQLCYRLDGIPLALELAAARVRSLPLEEINTRLNSRFRLLTGKDRTVLPRQQTLRALVDWSYDLLTESERMLLARLSVFSGGWTLAAAESACGFAPLEEWEIFDLLIGLVDKSLVLVEEQEGSSRYRMLETIRQYAAEKLEEGEDAHAVRERHLSWFVGFAEEAQEQLSGPAQPEWLKRLEKEHDNLRAALDLCLTDGPSESESVLTGLRLSVALWRFWSIRCHFAEGRDYLRRALAPARQRTWDEASHVHMAGALTSAGHLASSQGDPTASRPLYEESLALCRTWGNQSGIAASLSNLGNVAWFQGDREAARALYEENLAIRREMQDRSGMAASLYGLGALAIDEGDYETARPLLEESLAIHREIGDKHGTAASLFNLSDLACQQRDYARARPLLAESLILFRDLGDRRGSAFAFWSLAEILLSESAARQAVLLWGAAHTLREQIGAPLSERDQADHDAELEKARAILGNGAFTTAWEEGRAMSWEQALDFALDALTGGMPAS